MKTSILAVVLAIVCATNSFAHDGAGEHKHGSITTTPASASGKGK